jgi:hypothetical protein
MPGHSKLANHEHVHRSPKRPRNFVRNWYAAPRKGQDHKVVPVGEALQVTGKYRSGVSSIGKPERLAQHRTQLVRRPE